MRDCIVCNVTNVIRVIKSRKLTYAVHVVTMKEGRRDFKSLTGIPTVKRLLGKSTRRWEDNIRTYLKEMVVNSRNWVDSAQDMDY